MILTEGMSVMKYKKLLAIISALFIVIGMISSCGKDELSDHKNTSASNTSVSSLTSTSSVTSSSTDINVTPPDPPVIDKYRMDQKITYLSCVFDQSEDPLSPEILPLGDGKLLLLYNEYKQESDSFVSTFKVVDILNDTIITNKSIDGSMTLISAFDGGFIIDDYSEMTYRFFDTDLKELKQYTPPEPNGKFSPDGKKYYFISAGKLWFADVATNKLTCIESEYGIRYSAFIDSISGDGRAIFLYGDSSVIGYDSSAMVGVDLISGKTIVLACDLYLPSLNGDYLYFHQMVENDGQIKEDDDEIIDIFYVAESSGKSAVGFKQGEYAFSSIANSAYFTCAQMGDDTDLLSMYVGTLNGDVCDMTFIAGGDDVYYYGSFAYMDEEQLISFSIADTEGLKIGIIDTRLLETDKTMNAVVNDPPVLIDSSISEKYTAALTIPDVPEYLSEQRKRADALEEKYGIKIYISSQCKGMVISDKDYLCTDEFFLGDASSEKSFIDSVLDDMETVLKKYPEGFFKQFKTVTGDGGLRFCLTGEILDGFSAAFSIAYDEWYNMVFDVRYNMIVNLPHEIWHSTESYIYNCDYTLLSDEMWSSFNPEGFTYSEDYGSYDYIDSQYCFTYEEGAEWYFYDSYGKINSREDKARIMEVAMSPEAFDTDFILSSAPIQKKLGAMCSAIREAFDTQNWTDVFWERYVM